jgi:hypothetical protein
LTSKSESPPECPEFTPKRDSEEKRRIKEPAITRILMVELLSISKNKS